MSPRAGPRVGACGDHGAGTERARRARRGASPGRGLLPSRSASAGGSQVLSRCRGPPGRVGLVNEKDRATNPVSQRHIGAFRRRTRSVRAV